MASNSRDVPRDLIAGLLFLGVGIAILIAVPSQIGEVDHELEVGPRYVPTMMGIIITGLSVLLIARTAIGIVRRKAERIDWVKVVPSKEAVGVVGLIVVWLVGLNFVSFLVMTPVITVLALLLFRVKKILYYGIALAFVVAVWAAFTFILNVRLP